MNNPVELKNLHIKASNNTLVNNVSLTVKEGEIFGLVGESGSGKTLTAKAIIDLLPEGLTYTADKIITAGKDMLTASDEEKRDHIGKKIGYIPQNTVFYLHPLIKIKNQIGDGYIQHMHKTKKEALEKAEVLLSKVGFKSPKTVLNYYPWQLSGGMRQRCNIAMALMNDPKLIIADEPTTALDTTVQKQVMELFKSINEEMKLSILLISHDLGLVKRYSHSLGVMYAGQIVESGCTETVFNEPGHPYTRLLIKIIPSLKMKKNEPLTEIPGFVKDKDRDSKGCLFYCRCPKAMDICKEGVKEHTDDTGDHYYRCNLE